MVFVVAVADFMVLWYCGLLMGWFLCGLWFWHIAASALGCGSCCFGGFWWLVG